MFSFLFSFGNIKECIFLANKALGWHEKMD